MTSTAPAFASPSAAEPPEPVILAPADGLDLQPGDIVNYQGSATDPDDGTLPPSALDWTVLLHHNTHIHTFVGSTGASGSFQTEHHGRRRLRLRIGADGDRQQRPVPHRAAAAAADARHHAADRARVV